MTVVEHDMHSELIPHEEVLGGSVSADLSPAMYSFFQSIDFDPAEPISTEKLARKNSDLSPAMYSFFQSIDFDPAELDDDILIKPNLLAQDKFKPSHVLLTQPLKNPIKLERQAHQPTMHEKAKNRRGVSLMGAIAIGAALYFVGSSLRVEPSSNQSFAQTSTPNTEAVAPIPTISTTSSTALETTTTPAPTTTEAPAPINFEANPGDLIGVLHMPKLCEDIQIYEYSEQEKISGMIGKGKAQIDRTTLDPKGPEHCDLADQRMGPGATTRDNRTRPNLRSFFNPNGNVDAYIPVAGHEHGTSSYANNANGSNFVIAGHGSTESAPFADSSSLKLGDTAVFSRSDGRTYTYVMLSSELVPENDYDRILHYSAPGFDSFMTTYRCSDAEGNTGSSTNRYVTRWGLVSVSSVQNQVNTSTIN